MTAPFAKGFSTAYKRARSQDSPTPLASPPVLKATKIEEDRGPQFTSRIPAFLRQSQSAVRAKFNDLAWKEKLRILQGRSDPSSQWVQDASPHVMKRNRYGNVQPWEKSRIHLKVAQGKSDYINASPISLRDPRTGVETKFIATQGPKQSGLSHFWHMIWQETTDVAVIVMLTQTHDGTTEKCFQYFPLNIEAGPFQVEPLDRATGTPEGSVTFLEYHLDLDSRTEIRKLSLKFGAQTRDVWHFLFSGWPDFAVPEDKDRTALLELLKLCAEKNTSPSNPRIIHCSAGVGRSGTFIALEYLLAQVDSGAILDAREGEDMIYDVVNRLREQRMLMVQMEGQYQFLYDVIRDQLKERHLQVSGQQSPKLQMEAGDMKAAISDDASGEGGFFSNVKTDESWDAAITEMKAGEGQVEEPRAEGQDPNVP
ncbi:MAG: hypothetical protein ASARMPREDX12_009337 [Alectoria sarmentosa]|nr:MAG: hypothetical protein ASARMPRED_008079 [Alectoria sarmentosa]CAD6579690.1 MAG: hypothetical protein ASARMPREDX12_009337 [Alectoria sarmentosa]